MSSTIGHGYLQVVASSSRLSRRYSVEIASLAFVDKDFSLHDMVAWRHDKVTE